MAQLRREARPVVDDPQVLPVESRPVDPERDGAVVREAIEALAGQFASSFRDTLPREVRLVGREAEYPLVRDDGRAGDMMELWDDLRAAGSFTPTLDDPERNPIVVDVTGPDGIIAMEAGRATAELKIRPCEDLWQLEAASARLLGYLLQAARRSGMRVLGFGIQPRSAPVASLRSPKRRFNAHLSRPRPLRYAFTTPASDQVQVDITRGELVDAINILNLMSGTVIALTANSSVYRGRPGRFLSGREALLQRLGEPRHGLTPRPFTSVEDYVAYISAYECSHLRQNGEFIAFNRPFVDYLAEHGPDFETYLQHEHRTWNSARPKAEHSTIEIRPACQQPPAEPLAAAALNLGLVEAMGELKGLIDALGAERCWPVMRRYRRLAVTMGPRAPEPVPGFLEEIVRLAQRGLQRRGRGEEAFLQPIWSRLAKRQAPGDQHREVFKEEGIAGLLRSTSLEP